LLSATLDAGVIMTRMTNLDSMHLTICMTSTFEVPASRYPSIGAYGASALVVARGAVGWRVADDERLNWDPNQVDTVAERGAGSGRDVIEGSSGALYNHLARMCSLGIAQPAGTQVCIGSLAAARQRLKKRNLQPLAGIPLIAHAIRKPFAPGVFDEVWDNSEHPDFDPIAEAEGRPLSSAAGAIDERNTDQ
jgi:hypothetical protein